MRTPCLLALTVLAACSHREPRLGLDKPVGPGWQRVIRDDDRKRLSGLWNAWTHSLEEVQAAGQGKAVAALGPVAMPEAGRSAAFPAPGLYRCRTVKLGRRGDMRGTVLSTGPFEACTLAVDDRGGLQFQEQVAGRRIAGRLYPDGDRMIFLGSMALGQEMGVMAYGTDADRDQVGVLRAVGDRRWRLELPWPRWESNLDLIEIVAG